jgi:hypothetical protein
LSRDQEALPQGTLSILPRHILSANRRQAAADQSGFEPPHSKGLMLC